MNENIIRLLHLADPSLPIGSYAHSSGLETYVQLGVVKDMLSARDFINGMLSYNFHFTDGYFAGLAYDAAVANDIESLMLLDEECTALKLPSETRQASQKLGTRLLKNFRDLCANHFLQQYCERVLNGKAHGHYCLAFGVCAASLEIEKVHALTGFYYSAASGFVVNCVKLIPLGQQQGQEMLYALSATITDLVKDAMAPRTGLRGLCCPAFEIRCMQHEHLYSRLYMS